MSVPLLIVGPSGLAYEWAGGLTINIYSSGSMLRVGGALVQASMDSEIPDGWQAEDCFTLGRPTGPKDLEPGDVLSSIMEREEHLAGNHTPGEDGFCTFCGEQVAPDGHQIIRGGSR